ncbi:MAG: FKBP-type peptidyl-prolyl cis-trans isomerase [Gammaproteobacteria bacterium]|nr:FKBP-type peptidyl-prolyl cis-trans isomerase [Gammaproteobacteria bacterium]
MRAKLTGLAAAVALVAAGGAGAAGPALETDRQQLGYTVGFQIGHSLKADQLDVDLDALAQGIRDVMSGNEARLTEEQMMAAIDKMQADRVADRERMAAENLEESRKFLEQNGKRDGVTQTASGLQYEVKQAGSGQQPTPTDTVVVHYRGTLIDGTEFDSSHSRGEPVSFRVNEVIDGWQEVLPLMKEGAEWRVYIPSELAYGSRGAGQDIPPNSALVFDIELISIEKE